MRTLLSAGAIAVMATSAFAGDWTGGYVGLGFGYGDVNLTSGLPGGEDYTYGIHAGYDYDFGDWVVGGELEYDWLDIGIINGAATVDHVARLKVKVGYDFGPAMSYLIAGSTKAYTSGVGDDTGYLYGIGAAYAFTPQWMLSAEVLRHEYSDFNSTGVDVDAETVNLRASFRF